MQKLALNIGCGNKPEQVDGYHSIGIDLKSNTAADALSNLENLGTNIFIHTKLHGQKSCQVVVNKGTYRTWRAFNM